MAADVETEVRIGALEEFARPSEGTILETSQSEAAGMSARVMWAAGYSAYAYPA
jgi:hypothetical protein